MENTNMERGSKIMMVVLGLIMALVLGGLVGYMLGKGMEPETVKMEQTANSSQPTVKSAELQVTLDGLLREHVTTNLAVTRNIVDNASAMKLQGSLDAQTANAGAIANAVGSIYGDEAKAAITTPFVEHLTQSNNYAKAVAAGDTAAEATALTALQGSLRQVADVFNSVIPSLSSDTLYEALNAHETLMNQVAEEYKAGNYKKAYELERDALTQISGGAKALAGGIVKSKPDMFK